MEPEKTIIIITNNYPFGTGEEFLETEIKYLNKRFDRVVVLSQNSRDEKTREVPEGIKVYRYSETRNYLSYLKIIKYLFTDYLWEEIKVIKEVYKLDLNSGIMKALLAAVHTGNQLKDFLMKIAAENEIERNNLFLYSYWCNKAAFALALYKKEIPAVKVFSRAHGYDLYFERRKQNYLPLKKFVLDNLDRVFFISEHGKRYMEEKFNTEKDYKLKVSRLGINNNYEKAEPSSGNTLELVSCSFISPVKRVELIIKALSQINSFDVSWTHLGRGVNYIEIKKLAESLLTDKSNISFDFKGYMPNLKVYDYYKGNKIDALINVSFSEGIPVTMMEAFSFSIPVIATDVGGVSEIVNDKNGILLPAAPSPEEIAGAIAYINYLPPDKVENLRENAYNTWVEKYNAEINYNQFIDEIKCIDNKED